MKSRRRSAVPLVLAAALVLTSCGDDPTNVARGPAATGSSTSAPTTTTAPEDSMAADDPQAQAIADLAERLGIDPDTIEVATYEEVTWRDGSLGCPKPGRMYTQALVPGYRIILRAEGVAYAYHGSAGGPPFYCDNPDPGGATVG